MVSPSHSGEATWYRNFRFGGGWRDRLYNVGLILLSRDPASQPLPGESQTLLEDLAVIGQGVRALGNVAQAKVVTVRGVENVEAYANGELSPGGAPPIQELPPQPPSIEG